MGLKPLQCRHCSKEFRIKESYERHMLKCHNEVISLPEIYFEMPEESISEEPSKTTSSNSVRVFKSIGDSKVQEPASVCISSNRNEKIIEKKTFNKDSPQDMGLVVHFVQGVTQVESSPVHLTTNDSGQMQLNYPLLSSTANAEENEILSSNANIEENSNITLENLANQISCSDKETVNAEEKGATEQTPAATVHETNEADKAKSQMIETSTQSTAERQDLQNNIQRETGAVRKKVSTATMDTQGEETLLTLECADDCELQLHWESV
ncbi:hypothetical protein Hamer_G006433 [Homarus americanus]|uniref:C2H2-type domain-containing protein n=1 Tax=Homarus americanus TaxID=6706 RepID=A0A8J5MPM3_HOMAM|nr:hypothetical protein Hamer_G006433 [Homarus americanus]